MAKRPSNVYTNTSGRRALALEKIVRGSYGRMSEQYPENHAIAQLFDSYTEFDQPITILERDLSANRAVLDELSHAFGYRLDHVHEPGWTPGFLHTPQKKDGAYLTRGLLRGDNSQIKVQTRVKSVPSIARKVYFEHARDVFDSASYIEKYGSAFELGHEIEFPMTPDDMFIQHGGGRCAIEDVHGIKLVFDTLDELEFFRDKLYSGVGDLHVYRVKDYIKNPKKNGYRSLHMVLGSPSRNGNKVFADIHMETQEMFKYNEDGGEAKRSSYMQRRLDSAYLHKYGDVVVITHQGLSYDELNNCGSKVPSIMRLSPEGTYGLRCASNIVAFTDDLGKVIPDPTPMERFHNWYNLVKMGPNNYDIDLRDQTVYDAAMLMVRELTKNDNPFSIDSEYILHNVGFDGERMNYNYAGVEGKDLSFRDFRGVLPIGPELPVMHINLVNNK